MMLHRLAPLACAPAALRIAALVGATFAATLVVVGCPGTATGAGEGEEGEGEGEGGAGATSDITLEKDTAIAVAHIDIIGGIAVATRNDGRAVIAFINDRTDGATTDCNPGFGTGHETAKLQDVVVADEQADGSFRQRTVDSIPQTHGDALSLAVDPVSDNVVIAYTGGAIAVGACVASDLMIAEESGDVFSTPSNLIAGSDTGSLCRTPQSICAQGDVVGLFPSLAHDSTGANWALSYLDTHFGFADKDIHASDMEIGIGTTPTAYAFQTIDSDAGAGWFSNAGMTTDGLPFVVQNIIASDTLENVPGDPNSGTFTLHAGVFVSTQQSDGTWVDVDVFQSGVLDNRASAAASTDGIFALYRETGTGQLLLERSVDGGKTFPKSNEEFLERTGLTGFNPGVGVLSDGSVIAAYGHCNDVVAGNNACDVAKDGVRIAWKDSISDAKFNKKTFTGTAQNQDGLRTALSIAPDDSIVVASFSTSPTNDRTLHALRFKKVPK